MPVTLQHEAIGISRPSLTLSARRYHWHSEFLRSFVDNPHTGICGVNQGLILNLTDANAGDTKKGMLNIAREDPAFAINEFQKLVLPADHNVRITDVNLKRLGALLWLAREKEPVSFEELLLLEGAGPRTIQSLALVSEVIHGTSSRFRDPARFSFAHGGKDGHPFPVPLNVYDETIHILEGAIEKAKIGITDKKEAIKKLHALAVQAEDHSIPGAEGLDAIIREEHNNSWKYGGRTVFGKSKPPEAGKPEQLRLFE